MFYVTDVQNYGHAGRPVASVVKLSGDEGDLEELAGPTSSGFGFPSDLPSSCAPPS